MVYFPQLVHNILYKYNNIDFCIHVPQLTTIIFCYWMTTLIKTSQLPYQKHANFLDKN